MGDHRAKRSGSRRSASVTPAGGRRALRSTPAPAAGPQPAQLSAQLSARPLAQAPASRPAPAGKRRAARPVSTPLSRRLPSVPALAGVATLAIAALGATTSVAASDPVQPAAVTVHALAPASALSGSSASSNNNVVASRGQVVSRDSSRSALAAAASTTVDQEAEATVKQRNVALARFAKDAESQAAKIAKNAWVLPLSGYRLTASFGQSSGLWSRTHTGLDFAAPSGTPILAVAGGVITETGYDGSYGNKTVITLDDGTELWFCHQTSYAVSTGDTVRAGEVIGYVGSTGNSTGSHLHLEVRPGGGDPVDPYQALVIHGVTP